MPYAHKQPANAQLKWFATDTEGRYKKHQHPLLGVDDVSYQFNSYGYRCPEFDWQASDEGRLSIVAIGASEVFGLGVPEEKTFLRLFANLVEKYQGRPVIGWNLATCGSSPDYLARILFSALPVLKPDIVLLVFPFPKRREYFNDAGRLFMLANSRKQQRFFHQLKTLVTDPEFVSQLKANLTLSSDYNDQINLFKNYQICESLCEKHQPMWLFSGFHSAIFDPIESLIKTENFVSPGLLDFTTKHEKNPAFGYARDGWHPGIKPHEEMAGLFFERLKALYSSRLQAR